ncbi:MAG: hypothetical protein H6755_06380 [Candidatus Omnitrophica bacterium]|nr:hypothetical protein [Candidatus Omnitrophota bacterium]MCB9748015.1 hypothetical protein [Candidatus Omnitrophota bacterium]
MCHIITAVLPKKVEKNSVQSILNEYEMSFDPINNSFVKNQMSDDMQYLLATQGMCNCGTAIGSNKYSDNFDDEIKKEIKKLKKKGWSDSKMERWKADKIKSHDKVGVDNARYSGFKKLIGGNELTHWISFFNAMINEGKTDYVGILLHWYTGGLEDEEVEIADIIKTNLNRVNEDFLKNVKEDSLYLIKRD